MSTYFLLCCSVYSCVIERDQNTPNFFAIAYGDLGISQGNFVSEDSSGLCHLRPQWYLPEWLKEEEQTVAV